MDGIGSDREREISRQSQWKFGWKLRMARQRSGVSTVATVDGWEAIDAAPTDLAQQR
jgi:hypothetical protein